MNTIPLIFNQRAIDRTVLGGAENEGPVSMPVSCIILNRSGNQYRNLVFDTLAGRGFEKIICVESNDSSKNLDELSLQYPTIKFLIPHEEVTPGDMINLGIAECTSSSVRMLPKSLWKKTVFAFVQGFFHPRFRFFRCTSCRM